MAVARPCNYGRDCGEAQMLGNSWQVSDHHELKTVKCRWGFGWRHRDTTALGRIWAKSGSGSTSRVVLVWECPGHGICVKLSNPERWAVNREQAPSPQHPTSIIGNTPRSGGVRLQRHRTGDVLVLLPGDDQDSGKWPVHAMTPQRWNTLPGSHSRRCIDAHRKQTSS